MTRSRTKMSDFHGARVCIDAAAGNRGRAARRRVERGGAGGNARSGGAYPRGRDRDGVSGQRNALPVGELLGRAPNEELTGVGPTDPISGQFAGQERTGDQETRSGSVCNLSPGLLISCKAGTSWERVRTKEGTLVGGMSTESLRTSTQTVIVAEAARDNPVARRRDVPVRVLRRAHRRRGQNRRSVQARQHDRRRGGAKIPDRSRRLPAGGGACAGARGHARRFLSLAPQRARAAIGVRSGTRLAEFHVCHHFSPGRHAR